MNPYKLNLRHYLFLYMTIYKSGFFMMSEFFLGEFLEDLLNLSISVCLYSQPRVSLCIFSFGTFASFPDS